MHIIYTSYTSYLHIYICVSIYTYDVPFWAPVHPRSGPIPPSPEAPAAQEDPAGASQGGHLSSGQKLLLQDRACYLGCLKGDIDRATFKGGDVDMDIDRLL